MQLTALDNAQLFSISAWHSSDGWTVGTQRFAGDPVKYATRRTLSEAIAALVEAKLPAPPYQVRA